MTTESRTVTSSERRTTTTEKKTRTSRRQKTKRTTSPSTTSTTTQRPEPITKRTHKQTFLPLKWETQPWKRPLPPPVSMKKQPTLTFQVKYSFLK